MVLNQHLPRVEEFPMKTKFIATVAAFSAFISASAFAHGDLIEMTTVSVKEGLAQFKKDHPEHATHFTGVKAWPVGSDIKLKMYLPDNTTINYTCVHKENPDGTNNVVCTMEM